MWESTRIKERNETFLGVKISLYELILKILRGNVKQKVQRHNICWRCPWAITNGIKVRHQVMCEQWGWAPKGVDMRQCANKDVGLRRGEDWESHIDWKREWVLARTLAPKESRLWDLTSHGGGLGSHINWRKYQWERWVSKGGGLWDPHRKEAEPRTGWTWDGVAATTLDLEGGGLWDLMSVGEEN